MTSERKGVLLVAAAALLWSTGGIGIKWLDEPPLVIAWYRSAFAGAALILLFRPRVWRWTPAFLIGLVSYAACLTTFVLATKWTSAANAIFIQYFGVVWVLLAAPLLLHEPFRRKDAGAVAVAFAGMLLFFVGRFETRGFRGELAALASSLFFATLVLSLRRERGSRGRGRGHLGQRPGGPGSAAVRRGRSRGVAALVRRSRLPGRIPDRRAPTRSS